MLYLQRSPSNNGKVEQGNEFNMEGKIEEKRTSLAEERGKLWVKIA